MNQQSLGALYGSWFQIVMDFERNGQQEIEIARQLMLKKYRINQQSTQLLDDLTRDPKDCGRARDSRAICSALWFNFIDTAAKKPPVGKCPRPPH